MNIAELGSLDSSSRMANTLDKLAYFGLCAFILVLPWGVDSTVVSGLTPASWIALLPLGFITLRMSVGRCVRPFCRLHFLLLLFTFWVAASLTWSIDPESTFTRIGTYVQMLVFVGLIWELASTKVRVHGLILSYVFGSGIASAKTIANYLMGRTTSQEMNQWETYRYSVDGVNADELGLIIALSIPLALYVLTTTKNNWIKALCWTQVVLGITAIFLTATRGALLAVAVGIVMMVGPTLAHMSRFQKGVGAIALVALVCCTVLLIPQTSVDRLLSTGTELTQGTLTHRTVIWAAGLDAFRDHALLGVGAGAYGAAIVKVVDIPWIAHNTFISVLVELGVVGAFLMMLVLASILYLIFGLHHFEKRMWLAVLATWATGASTVSWENRKITWLLFGLVAAQAYARNPRMFELRKTNDRESPSLTAEPAVTR